LSDFKIVFLIQFIVANMAERVLQFFLHPVKLSQADTEYQQGDGEKYQLNDPAETDLEKTVNGKPRYGEIEGGANKREQCAIVRHFSAIDCQLLPEDQILIDLFFGTVQAENLFQT
jgi:hypothetical protein